MDTKQQKIGWMILAMTFGLIGFFMLSNSTEFSQWYSKHNSWTTDPDITSLESTLMFMTSWLIVYVVTSALAIGAAVGIMLHKFPIPTKQKPCCPTCGKA